VISRKTHRQASAVNWKDNYFFHGMLVNGATVEIACYFLKAQMPEIRPRDRIVFRVHIGGEQQALLIDERLHDPKSNCYVVSYCFGRDSEEYRQMIDFRDRILIRTVPGRYFTRQYYLRSPGLVRLAAEQRFVRFVMQRLVRLGMAICVRILRRRSRV
jgi:hypothetical protein